MAVLTTLAACGDDDGGGDAATTGDTTTAGDTTGDAAGDAEVSLPTGCYLPAAPTTTMDCALMCEKVDACGIAEDDCLASCVEYTYLLAPDAGPRVEACFVGSPCNNHPAAYGAIGCIAVLKDDEAYTPPAGNAAACTALSDKATTCGLSTTLKDYITFLCDIAGPGLSADLMARASACTSESCEDFVGCLDGSSCIWDGLDEGDDIPDERDACNNERDEDAIGTTPVIADALACVDACSDGTFTCARDCLVDGGDLTGPCSTCFTVLARCIRGPCEDACADPTADACHACLGTEGCAAAFATCAGVPVPGGPDDELDCTAAEQAEIAGEDMVENVAKCVGQCEDGATCNNECMQALLFVDERCSDCAGRLATCVGGPCRDACDDFNDVPGCYRCLAATDCVALFDQCSGVSFGPPEHALCLGPADVARADDGTAWAATAACVGQCGGEAACVATCVGEDAGVSAPCAPCYADFGTCTKACAACLVDPASPECATCIQATTCTTAFEDCAGLAPYDPPAAGTATCEATVACTVACTGASAAACVEACIQAAEPAVLGLARDVTKCLRDDCAGQDISCLATTCLADYQACYTITPELTCSELDTCLAACATLECQAGCFTTTATADDADRLVAMNACIVRFCGADGPPTPSCAGTVLNDIALCGVPYLQCHEPEAELPALTCREVATCIDYCPDLACAQTCAPAGFPAGEQAEVNAYVDCFVESCEDDFTSTCRIDSCWGPLNTCFGEPDVALTCDQIITCQQGCVAPSCMASCVASAASEEVALAHDALLTCVFANCTGPDGNLLEGCEVTVINEGGVCNAQAIACYQP